MIAPVRVVSLSFLLADFVVAYIELLFETPGGTKEQCGSRARFHQPDRFTDVNGQRF